jgi:drug/metabolite transporter (DMT)-like permease
MVEWQGLRRRLVGQHSMSRKNPFLPYLALAVGILSLGFSALFVRWANVPGPVMGVYRLGIASLVMVPLFIWRRRGKARLAKSALFFALLGGLLTALDHAFWNTAVLYTTAANATLFGNTAPLWVALAAWLVFKERLRTSFWIGMALTLTGAAVVLGSDFLLHPDLGLGDVIALAAAIFYGGYLLVTQRGRQYLDTLSYVWLVSLSAALILLGVSLGAGLKLTGFSPQTYLAFVGAALVSQVLGYLAVAYALGHLPASLVAPTLIGQPVVTALLSIPFLGELMLPAQWIGGLGVLAGIYLVHRSRQETTATLGEETTLP